MKIRHAVRVATFAALLVAGGGAQAQNCDTFTDVLASDSACGAIQWIKNRGITLGCTSLTAFCPTDFVTRAQMALFLERLGRSQTPTQFFVASGGVAIPTIDQNNPFRQVCISPTLAPANFPRSARIRGNLAMTAAGDAPMWMYLVHDDNPPGNFVIASAVPLTVPFPGANGFHSLSWTSDLVAIPAGVPYRFAIGLSFQSGSSGTIIGTGPYQCQVEVLVFNANGSSPPFDE